MFQPAAPTLIVLIALIPAAARADELTHVPAIAVSGVAEVQVVPDEVVISLGVETFAKSLDEARKANNERIRRILNTAVTLGLDDKAVQTGHMSVSLRYERIDGAYRYDRLAGYEVERSASITLTDLTKLDSLIAAVLDGGANRMHGLDFRTGELRKHRDEARRLALQAAREKATHMAGVLGQTIGRPLRIIETTEGRSGSQQFRDWSSNSNVSFIEPGDSVTSDTFAPGTIIVKAGVSVEFELQQ